MTIELNCKLAAYTQSVEAHLEVVYIGDDLNQRVHVQIKHNHRVSAKKATALYHRVPFYLRTMVRTLCHMSFLLRPIVMPAITSYERRSAPCATCPSS